MASAIIIDRDSHKAKNIEPIDYSITNITHKNRSVKINEVLPFRVRFTTIGIAPAYSNVPGIGLQVIGINNYIL